MRAEAGVNSKVSNGAEEVVTSVESKENEHEQAVVKEVHLSARSLSHRDECACCKRIYDQVSLGPMGKPFDGAKVTLYLYQYRAMCRAYGYCMKGMLARFPRFCTPAVLEILPEAFECKRSLQ